MLVLVLCVQAAVTNLKRLLVESTVLVGTYFRYFLEY